MLAKLLSAREIRALKPRPIAYKVIENAPRGEGRLIVKVHPTGLKEFYYRTRSAGGDSLVRIGRYEQTPGYGGITLEAARTALAKLVAIQRATGDVKAELLSRKNEKARARLLEERAARLGTFDQLMDAYVSDMRARGRITARAVEGSFLRDVKTPFPNLCRTRARDIAPGDIQQILARLVKKGVRRGVNMLRSHLAAAFQHAAKSDNDPTRLAHDGAVFDMASNPVALVPRKAEFERAGNRHLSESELCRYWHAIDSLQTPVVGDFLRFNLALGGQRAVQLLRASWRDFDFEGQTLLLKDPKGRAAMVKDHLLPLTRFALEMLEPLQALNTEEAGPFVTINRKSLHAATVSKAVNDIWKSLVAEDTGKSAAQVIPHFQFSDLRRTCETQLASIGISLEMRAQLLSHGRSGVQARHYDRYSYVNEKRRALEEWAMHLQRVFSANPDRPVSTTLRYSVVNAHITRIGGTGHETSLQPRC